MKQKQLIKLLRWNRYKEAESTADLFNSLGLYIVMYVEPGEQRQIALDHLMKSKEAVTKAIVNPWE